MVTPQKNKRHMLDSQLKALRPAKESPYFHNDGNGLYIKVYPSGVKSFVLRRKINGKTKRTTLGQYPEVSLRQARNLAGAERIKDQETKRDSLNFLDETDVHTFGALLDRYFEDEIREHYKRPRQVRLYIENRIPDEIKDVEIADMNEHMALRFRGAVQTWLKRYARESGPVGANRCLSIMKQATRYGVAAGKILVDPLAPLTKKQVGGTEEARKRVLTDEEIHALWHSESAHTPLFRFLLLTGQRIGEAQQARWEHIQDDRWIIPAENSKNGKEHWVPITETVTNVFEELSRESETLFGYRSTTGVQAWLRRWLIKNEIEPRYTPHDLRRTMSTRMNELGVEPYIVEKMLNHSMSGVMATYNHATYDQERIAAAELWAEHLLKVVS